MGVADFDGDGRREIAVVRTPHIGGILKLYEHKGDRLVQEHSVDGFSNHAIGSRELGLSAVLDVNRDGVADIVLPNANRSRLRIVTFKGGRFAELAQVPVGGQLVTGLWPLELNGDGRKEVVYGTADETIRVLVFK